jgi:hypothetical protein
VPEKAEEDPLNDPTKVVAVTVPAVKLPAVMAPLTATPVTLIAPVASRFTKVLTKFAEVAAVTPVYAFWKFAQSVEVKAPLAPTPAMLMLRAPALYARGPVADNAPGSHVVVPLFHFKSCQLLLGAVEETELP